MSTYRLWDGASEEIIEADDLDDAIDQANDWVRGGDWNQGPNEIVYVDVWIRIGRGEPGSSDYWEDVDRITVQIEAEEPLCDERSSGHDWQSPYDLLGGCQENPGVWGHGGGVVITEVCVRCGCARKTDTWAQRMDTGEQGLTEVTYEPGRFVDALAEMTEDDDR